MVSSYVDVFIKLLVDCFNNGHPNQAEMVCNILSYMAQNKAACEMLLQNNKHLPLIEAACYLMASEETGIAQKGLKTFTHLVANCQEYISHYST
jgi:hypothetical protein